MITRADAATLSYGNEILSLVYENADGTPLRVRVMGKVKFWKTRIWDFKIPVKYGLYDSFYITPFNAESWTLPENHVDNGGDQEMMDHSRW